MNARIVFTAVMAALLAIGAAGCSKDSKEKLVGTWKMDKEALKKQIQKKAKGKKVPEAKLKQAVSMGPEFEFSKDGSLTMTMNVPMKKEPVTKKGTYEVVSSDGDKLELKTNVEDQKEKVTVTFQGDDQIELQREGDDKTMVLSRSS